MLQKHCLQWVHYLLCYFQELCFSLLLRVTPSKKVTVVSQIAEQTFGRNFMYYFIQGTTALILILAANTGYSAFPLLAVNLAKDKFIPRMFTIRGDRLGYSNGIIILGVASIILIVAFKDKQNI